MASSRGQHLSTLVFSTIKRTGSEPQFSAPWRAVYTYRRYDFFLGPFIEHLVILAC